MKEVKNNLSMTYEDVLQNPNLTHFHEAIHLLQNRPHTDIFPKQYESAMMSVAEDRVVKLFDENPQISLKRTVSKVINRFPNDLSDALMTKITNEVIKKWTHLSTEHQMNACLEAYADVDNF